MIRSNPTAIPLRASDLKLLQAEIERRQGTDAPASAASGEQPAQGQNQLQQGAQKQTSDGQGYNALEDHRKRREGMTAAERIGLQ